MTNPQDQKCWICGQPGQWLLHPGSPYAYCNEHWQFLFEKTAEVMKDSPVIGPEEKLDDFVKRTAKGKRGDTPA